MTVAERFRVIRRWRAIIVAGVLIGVVVGWVSAPRRVINRTTFEATHTMIIDPQGAPDAQLYQAAALVLFGPVPNRVAARMGIDRHLVRAMVSAQMRDDLNALVITGRSTDGRQAEALADVTAEELVVELGGPKAPLRTLEPAVASPIETGDIEAPTSRPGRAFLLGGLGLLLGVGAAFAVERLDHRIWSKAAAEAALGVRVMTELPMLSREDRGRLLTGAHPSAFVEASRGLRTSVDRWATQSGDGDWRRVIAVTSPTGGEGATTTVAHLAVALGEIGRSVVVISADLRRPRLHLYFDRPREPGLTDVLRGAPDTRRLTDLNLVTTVRGVRFVASGAPVRNPSPLLDRVGDPLREARSLGDYVLIDAPPLLTTSDAADLARHADGVLLVVRAGRTSAGAAARSAELLERLNIALMGVVLIGSDGSPGRT